MKQRPGRKILDFLLYLLLRVVSALVGALPRRIAFRLGAFLGRLMRMTVRRSSKMALENLRQAFPQLPEGELERIHRGVFEHLGKVGIEMLRMERYSREGLGDLFQVEGQACLDEAVQLGRGVVIVSGHIGFWEGASWLLPQLGYPLDFLAKTVKNPYVDNYLAHQRQRAGGRLIDSRRAAGKIVRSLARKRVIGLLFDQRTSRQEGVEVDFFGRPAYATPVIARIAARYRAPIVPYAIHRTDNDTYRLVFEPMILLPEDDSPEAVREATALLTARIEAAIRRDITQWCWDYDRWSPKAKASWE